MWRYFFIAFCVARSAYASDADIESLRRIIASQQAEINRLNDIVKKAMDCSAETCTWKGSSVGLRGPQGEVGSQGPAGLVGPQGERGAHGPEGVVRSGVFDMKQEMSFESTYSFAVSILIRRFCQTKGFQYGIPGGEMSSAGGTMRNYRVVCLF